MLKQENRAIDLVFLCSHTSSTQNSGIVYLEVELLKVQDEREKIRVARLPRFISVIVFVRYFDWLVGWLQGELPAADLPLEHGFANRHRTPYHVARLNNYDRFVPFELID